MTTFNFTRRQALMSAFMSAFWIGTSKKGIAASSSLKAGAGASAIKLPAEIFPIQNFTSSRDPLMVRALAIADGKEMVVTVVIDMTSIADDAITFVQNAAASTLSADPKNVLVVASHTFSSPHIVNAHMQPTTEEQQKSNLFRDAVYFSVNEALAAAKNKMQPVSVGYSLGGSDVNVNRDIETVDGWWLGANEHGYSDKSAAVVTLFDRQGKPVAALANYAVQSSILNESTDDNGGKQLSSDLAGAACRFAEANLSDGFVCLFLVGAAGDQAPILQANRYMLDNQGKTARADLHQAGGILVDLLGERLGAEFVRLVHNAKPGATSTGLRIVNNSIKLPGQARPKSMADLHATRSYVYATADDNDTPYTIVALGDIALVGMQPELASKIGADLKAASPFKHTLVTTMVNGAAKYMADAASYDRMTYEAMNSSYAKGAAEIFSEAVKLELAKLSRK